MNYADEDVPFTRIHEFRHYHPERDLSHGQVGHHARASRFAQRDDEPYSARSTPPRIGSGCWHTGTAHGEHNTLFGGRLGSYKCLDMHMAIASALTAFENRIQPWLQAQQPSAWWIWRLTR